MHSAESHWIPCPSLKPYTATTYSEVLPKKLLKANMRTTDTQLPTTQPRARHGLRGAGLPKGCGHIQRATCEFRRQLEAAVMEARQEITLEESAYINTAFRAERHAQLSQRWLAMDAERDTSRETQLQP